MIRSRRCGIHRMNVLFYLSSCCQLVAMKKSLFLCVFLLICACTSEEITTYYLIRHAEKDRTDATNKNPSLNSEGLIRAKKWMHYFDAIELDAIYSTDYNRTKQTGTPTAAQKKLPIQTYDPSNMYDSTFIKATYGKSVLIVGHSNTTPNLVNLILKEKTYKDMKDTDNSSVYIVSIQGTKKTCRIVRVQ